MKRSDRPFLEIVTRHLASRPACFAKNVESLSTQTCDDWTQTVIVDDVGRGIGWAQAQLARLEPEGEYLWVLDDDDVCIRPTLVAELKMLAELKTPEIIMMKMYHGPEIGLQPPAEYWGAPPQHGHVGVSAIVTRADVWEKHRDAWATSIYSSDFLFIQDVFAARPLVFWHDVIASAVQRVSRGAPE